MDNRDLFDEGRRIPLVEEFYSIQGEGFHTGKPAYFIRIGGCDVGCSWCDTKYAWDPELFPPVEVDRVVEHAVRCPARAVVVTGGEPLMVNLNYLTGRLKEYGMQTFLETSGSHPFSGEWDWVCLSPKRHIPPVPAIYRYADELKIIIAEAEDFRWAAENAGRVNPGCILYIQPEWSVHKQIMPDVVAFVKENPAWRVSLQVHKYMRIP
ncbi:MAG: 7-carboxy-7-deazaguanine synthase QueE [Bacteroidales bacterium]|nr:7-carboxy-7-deazaguanine synthase QueE [Bacteroidales bacterium]